jgi:hypothetical protein
LEYTLAIHRKAHSELFEAVGWYETQKEGLGKAFFNAYLVERGKIELNSDYHSFRKGKYRAAKLKDFPYTIYYEVFPRKQIIHICAVHHGKRAARLRFRQMK